MARPIRPTALLLGLVAACTPTPPAVAPAPSPPAPAAPAATIDTVRRPLLREVPVPPAFAAAVAAGTRTETGAPGERYWQQGVSYRIDAELDPRTATVRGAERIVYRNRSPQALSSLVLNLYQNVFSEGVPRNRFVNVTGGVTLERVAAQGQTLSRRTAREIPVVPGPREDAPTGYSVEGTLARLKLPRPVAPGDSVVLEIDWRHVVPPAPSFRTGWDETLGARSYHVAQWYPQVATFDDVYGWDATPYLGDGEFYLEYGEFDVSVTLPEGYLVGATGVLQNPEEVLTAEARRRLAAALGSDSVTAVVTEADLEARNATQSSPEAQLTWRFRAENVRDFAFSTSRRFVWDATRAVIPDGSGGTRTVAVNALYRAGAGSWEQAARFVQHSIRFYSELLIPYLYPQITTAEGPIGGMEYPMLVFITRRDEPESLHGVTAHEVAHEWFPMMVGQNEASFAWMDEGFATFLEALAADDLYDRTDSYQGDLASYLRVAGSEAEVPLMRHTDLASPYGARTVAAYSKPGLLLRSLRAVGGRLGLLRRPPRARAPVDAEAPLPLGLLPRHGKGGGAGPRLVLLSLVVRDRRAGPRGGRGGGRRRGDGERRGAPPRSRWDPGPGGGRDHHSERCEAAADGTRRGLAARHPRRRAHLRGLRTGGSRRAGSRAPLP